jgi:hypothetical protein
MMIEFFALHLIRIKLLNVRRSNFRNMSYICFGNDNDARLGFRSAMKMTNCFRENTVQCKNNFDSVLSDHII